MSSDLENQAKDLERKTKDALGIKQEKTWYDKMLEALGGATETFANWVGNAKDLSKIAPELLKDENKNAWKKEPSQQQKEKIKGLLDSQNPDYKKILDSLDGLKNVMNAAVSGEDKVKEGAGVHNVAMAIYEQANDLKMPNVIMPAAKYAIEQFTSKIASGQYTSGIANAFNQGGGFPNGLIPAMGAAVQIINIEEIKAKVIEDKVQNISNDMRNRQGFSEPLTKIVAENTYREIAKEGGLTKLNEDFLNNLGKTTTQTIDKSAPNNATDDKSIENAARGASVVNPNIVVAQQQNVTASNAQDLPLGAVKNNKQLGK
jgi:hypothetical protein